MDAASYFAFQAERLHKKELADRRQVANDEEMNRIALGRAYSETLKVVELSSPSKEAVNPYGPIALPPLPPLAAHECDEIIMRMMNSDAASVRHIPESETSARSELTAWETLARDAIKRSLTLSLAPRAVARLAAEEGLWRSKIERSAQHDYQQFYNLRTQTLMYLIQHPQHPGSCFAVRRLLRQQEVQERWMLAVHFCGLAHAYHEEWSRLTLRLAQQVERQAMREMETLCRREVAEWSAICALGRPIIEELLDVLKERQQAWEHDVHRLSSLHAVRREIIAKIHDRITNKEDYILQEKMHLVERILSTQEALLEEVAEHDSDPSAFERLHGHYDLDRSWLTQPETQFGALVEYHHTLVKHRARSTHDHPFDQGESPASSRSVAAMRWVADVPWDSPNRRRVLENLAQQSVTAQETWKQYAVDHFHVKRLDEVRKSTLQIDSASPLRIAEGRSSTTAEASHSPLESLYNRVVGGLR
jgi:hypothetical protein